jgi:hypothetical protein
LLAEAAEALDAVKDMSVLLSDVHITVNQWEKIVEVCTAIKQLQQIEEANRTEN